MSPRSALVSVLLALLLTACAGPLPKHPTAASWEEHSARLRTLTDWTAEGKFALRSPELSESATLIWQQKGQLSDLHLSGPMGIAATSLHSDGKTLVIQRGEEVSQWDLNDASALKQRTGWDLPLLALQYWLRGLPAPGMEVQAMAWGPDPALLQDLNQDDWQVHYEAYASYGGFTLPTRLQIQRRDTRLRLIIHNWKASAP